jgi:hypothetical protein
VQYSHEAADSLSDPRIMAGRADNPRTRALRGVTRASDDQGLGPPAGAVPVFLVFGAQQPATHSTSSDWAFGGCRTYLHSSGTTAELLFGQRFKHGVNPVSVGLAPGYRRVGEGRGVRGGETIVGSLNSRVSSSSSIWCLVSDSNTVSILGGPGWHLNPPGGGGHAQSSSSSQSSAAAEEEQH